MIPENVLDVLMAIHTGKTNMQDRGHTIQVADVLDEEVADWLRENPRLYIKALEIVRGRIMGGQEE